ncbi:MAG: glyoxalase [Schaedlerella sp.]|nr:glyoxalase [Schaedlerella sp.]
MKLKNILFVVNDIEKSKVFYKELFGLMVIKDFGKNVILTEGLVLQERELWEKSLGKEVVYQGHDGELYFEENNMDMFLEKIGKSSLEVEYVSPLTEQDGEKRVVRLYDPDYHVIEVGESQECVVRRLLESGMTCEEVADKIQMPLDWVRAMENGIENGKGRRLTTSYN